MSKEAVEAVLGKATLDAAFRDALFAAPDRALAGYELSKEEAYALKSIDAENMGAMAGVLDERISKSAVSLDWTKKGTPATKPSLPTKPG